MLLAVAGGVFLVAPEAPYWPIAAPLVLVGVVALAFRSRPVGVSPWVVVGWALVPVVATRVAATASGDIPVADTVLGLTVAAQALVVRSRLLVGGRVLCAVLAAGFGLALSGEQAREVLISLTSGDALARAAVGVTRGGAGARGMSAAPA